MTPSTVTAGMHLRHASGAGARRVARRATAGTPPLAMALAVPMPVPMAVPLAVPLAVAVAVAVAAVLGDEAHDSVVELGVSQFENNARAIE